MTHGVRLRVRGDRACFTRPEHKAERVSYDVITPSAARGIAEAIHWKPAIRYVVERITVLNPIRFASVRRNEVSVKASAELAGRAMAGGARMELLVEENRAQRVSLILTDVDYLIDLRFEMTDKAGPEDNAAKHIEMLRRRARKGQCFHQPSLGCREFPARVELVEGEVFTPSDELKGEKNLGWMLLDIDFAHGRAPRFFRAVMTDGVIEVPALGAGEAP